MKFKVQDLAIFIFLMQVSFLASAAPSCKSLFLKDLADRAAQTPYSKLLSEKESHYLAEVKAYSEMLDPVQRSKFQARELFKILQKTQELLPEILKDLPSDEKWIALKFMAETRELFLKNDSTNTVTAEVAVDFSYRIATLLTLLQLPRERVSDGRLVYTVKNMWNNIYTRPVSYNYFNRPLTLAEILYAPLEPESVSIRREKRLMPGEQLKLLVLGEDVQIDFFNLMSNTNLHLAGMVYGPTVFDGSLSLPLSFLNHDVRAHQPNGLSPTQSQMVRFFLEEYLNKQHQIIYADAKVLSVLLFQIDHESNQLGHILEDLSKSNLHARSIRTYLNSIFQLTQEGHHQNTVPRIMNEGFYGSYLKDIVDFESKPKVLVATQKAQEDLAQIFQAALRRYQAEMSLP